VISRSALLVCFLLATTVTLSWGKRATESELDNGSGTTEETLLSDDEDFNFGLSDDGNDVTTTFDDDEDNEQFSSGDDEPSTTFPEDDEESEGSGDPDDETVKTNIMTKGAGSSEEDDDTSELPVAGTGNEDPSSDKTGKSDEDKSQDKTPVTEPTNDNISTSHFLAALIAGGAVGLLFALCVIMLLAYRIRKKDEGSYALDEQKKKPASPNAYQYTQGQEYYA